jgi:hypothetical protein
MFHYYTIFLRISGGEGLALSNVFWKHCGTRKPEIKDNTRSTIAGTSPCSHKVILHVVLKTSTPTVTMKPCDESHSVSDLILTWLCARTPSSGLISTKFSI